jgi:hypothetical protein
MPRWLPNALKRVHELAAAGKVLLTYKAVREGASLGLSPEDVRDVLAGVGAKDSAGRLASETTTREWMYVFKPDVGGQILYVKLVLRENCVVVSFHEDEGGGHEEDE